MWDRAAPMPRVGRTQAKVGRGGTKRARRMTSVLGMTLPKAAATPPPAHEPHAVATDDSSKLTSPKNLALGGLAATFLVGGGVIGAMRGNRSRGSASARPWRPPRSVRHCWATRARRSVTAGATRTVIRTATTRASTRTTRATTTRGMTTRATTIRATTIRTPATRIPATPTVAPLQVTTTRSPEAG